MKNLLTLSSCQQQSDTRQQQSNARQQLLDAGQPQPDIGQQSSRQKQQQQRQQDSRNQKHKQTEETDKLITLIALNQKLYPDGFTDVETEIERKETSLRKKEIRILIAGEYFMRDLLERTSSNNGQTNILAKKYPCEQLFEANV